MSAKQGPEFDNSPVSEGMRLGPVPPPDADIEPESARWLMESQALGFPDIYQLVMLREMLNEDKARFAVSDTVYAANRQRLDFEINKALAGKFMPEMRSKTRGDAE